MTFHYIRKNDGQGTIQRANGLGIGIPIRKLYLKGVLPLRASVEILRFCADILNDAMKNGFVHGDIKPDNLAVQNDGSIIINGYDRPRRSSVTPEGVVSLPGDIYGLGLIMLEVLSGQSGFDLPLDERLHNERVLEIFLQINWQEWQHQAWLPTMQEYLISLLFFDPTQRPHPLDIANILKEASQATSSLGLLEHIRRSGIRVKSEDETLEAARSLRSSALINPVEVMADSEGTATGYFTRDKIAEMFQEPVDDERARRQEWSPEVSLDIVPSTHSGSPTAPPTRDTPRFADPQMEVTAPIVEPPPTPDLKMWERQSAPPVEPPQWNQPKPRQQDLGTKPWEQPSQQPPSTSIPSPPPWEQAVHPTESPTPSVPPSSERPTVSNPFIQSNVQRPSVTHTPTPVVPPPPIFSVGAGQQVGIQPQFQPPPPSNPSSQSQMQGGIPKQWLLLGGAVLFMLVGTVLASVWWLTKENNTPTNDLKVERITPTQEPNPTFNEPIQEPSQEDVIQPKKKSKPRPKRKQQSNKAPTKVQNPKSSTSTKEKLERKQPTVKPAVKQAATTVGISNFDVTISFEGEATLQCGDGQRKEFVRQTTLTFQTRTVCRITSTNDERGALTAQKSGTIQCSATGEKIRCR